MQKEPKFFDMKRCSDLKIKQKIFELALLISTIDIDIDIQITPTNCLKKALHKALQFVSARN